MKVSLRYYYYLLVPFIFCLLVFTILTVSLINSRQSSIIDSYSFSDNQIVEFIDLLNQVELGGKVDENKASSNGAVSYCTIYFVIDETLTIIPGEYFKIGDTFYEFDNYDELWDKFIVFNSTK